MDDLLVRARRKALVLVALSMLLCFGAATLPAVLAARVILVLVGGLLGFVALGVMFRVGAALSQQVVEHEGEKAKVRAQLMSSVRQQKEISYHLQQRRFISELLQTISVHRQLQEVLDTILDQTMDFFAANSGFVMLIDKGRGDLYVEAAKARQGQAVQSGRLRMGEGVVGAVAASGTPVVRPGADKAGKKEAALMSAPLRIEGEVIGVLTVEESSQGFNESDLEFFSVIAAEAALAVEKARLYTEMERMSVTDGLTGIANRRQFDMRLASEILRAKRYSLPVSIIILDIDHFKSFNDKYGHQVGDLVLQHLAGLLTDSVRQTDLVARYGGEEFVVVSPDCTAEQAAGLAERIRLSVAAADFPGNEEHPVLKATVSLGVACYPYDGDDQDGVLAAADKALYYSKEHGRNQSTLASRIAADNVDPVAPG